MYRIIDLASPWEAMVAIGGIRGTLTGSEDGHADQYHRAVDAVRRYGVYAQKQNVSLVIEPINRFETNYINTIQDALQFIGDVDLHNLGILADIFHMIIEDANLVESLQLASDRIHHVQFTDSNRLAAGRGHIDFRVLAAALRDSGYRGYLSTETLPLPDSRTTARQAIEFFQSL